MPPHYVVARIVVILADILSVPFPPKNTERQQFKTHLQKKVAKRMGFSWIPAKPYEHHLRIDRR